MRLETIGMSPYLSQGSFQLSPRDQRHHLDKEQKMANILGRKGKKKQKEERESEERGGI